MYKITKFLAMWKEVLARDQVYSVALFAIRQPRSSSSIHQQDRVAHTMAQLCNRVLYA